MSNKVPPICNKCALSHWHFQLCTEGKKYVRVGYDSIKRTSDYQRLQYRSRPRLHYREEANDAS